jgi:hypothetical protein
MTVRKEKLGQENWDITLQPEQGSWEDKAQQHSLGKITGKNVIARTGKWKQDSQERKAEAGELRQESLRWDSLESTAKTGQLKQKSRDRRA